MRNHLLLLLAGVALGLGLDLGATLLGEKPPECGPATKKCVQRIVDDVKNRGWIGFEFIHRTSSIGDFTVSHLYAQGPAERAGLQKGDRIIGLGGTRAFHREDFEVAMKQWREETSKLRPGKPVPVLVVRDEATIELEMIPERYTGRRLATHIGIEMITYFPETYPGS